MTATTATKITAQIAQAREVMQFMIAQGFSAQTRERQERRINALKAKLQAATNYEGTCPTCGGRIMWGDCPRGHMATTSN